MDALLAQDRDHASELDPAEKLKQALDVMRAGIRLNAFDPASAVP
ncbi:MAG TPA: hypothetical protein VK745_22650 [Polyangiaceae bacterium]|jgi:hypothetical protein|nr:hypothetical protein [Polyangiaceae bacterium]